MKALTLLLLILLNSPAQARTLDVPRIEQGTAYWCWAAASSMVMKYHGVAPFSSESNFQCSMVQYMGLSGAFPYYCYYDCNLCPFPAPGLSSFQIVIDYYSKDLSRLDGTPRLQTEYSPVPGAKTRIAREIRRGNPIIAVIQPYENNYGGKHVVVIVGYKKGLVRINDSYPHTVRDPWLENGAKKILDGVYEIGYDDLKSKMNWTHTVYTKKVKK